MTSLESARENLMANMAKAKTARILEEEAKRKEYLEKEQARIKAHMEEKARREQEAMEKAIEKAQAALEKKAQSEAPIVPPTPEANKQPFVIDPLEKKETGFWWQHLPKRKEKRSRPIPPPDEDTSTEESPPKRQKPEPPAVPQQVVLQVTQAPVDPGQSASFFDRALQMGIPLFGLAVSLYLKNKYATKEDRAMVAVPPRQGQGNPFQAAFQSSYMEA